MILNDVDFIGQSIIIDTHADKVLILLILSNSSIVIESIKNFPVSVEGAFYCDSLNVDFKDGNQIIC